MDETWLKSNPVPGTGMPARRATLPLYEQIKAEVSERILSGIWPPGTVLPGEIELSGEFGVSIGTMRRALTELSREGLLSRRRKTGTVVNGRTPHHTLSQFFQFFRLHRRDGTRLTSETEVTGLVRRAASPSEAAALSLTPDAEVVDIARRRRIDGRAVMHESLVLPAVLIPGFPDGDPPTRLYLFLVERYAIRIAAVRENIRAEPATAADETALDMAGAGAVLVIEETAFDQSGRAVIRAWHRAVTDELMYVNEVN